MNSAAAGPGEDTQSPGRRHYGNAGAGYGTPAEHCDKFAPTSGERRWSDAPSKPVKLPCVSVT